MNDKDNNIYVSILGDSLSTLEGYNPEGYEVFYRGFTKYLTKVYTPDDTWWGYVTEHFGWKLLKNNSWSGSFVTHDRKCIIPSYGCSEERCMALGDENRKPDIIFVYMGTNDWGHGFKIWPENGKNDDEYFGCAYRTLLKNLKNMYPDSKIYTFTMSNSFCSKDSSYVYDPNFRDHNIYDYIDAIVKVGTEEGCEVVELMKENIMYDTIDGFHPTRDGMMSLGNKIIEIIASKLDNDKT